MTDICTFIKDGEDWLMSRILQYARETDYTKYTSTLRDAWRLSINMLSQTLCDAIAARPDVPELGPDENYTKDPIAAFGILEAQRHRERGVTLDMFLGLMKYYRQSYRDLFRESSLPDDEKKYLDLYAERFFDRIELGFIGEWTGTSEEDKLSELKDTNRRMTNEKNKYLTIFESQHDPVLLLNKDHDIENINFAAARLFIEDAVPGAAYYRHQPVKEEFPWLEKEVKSFSSTERNEIIFEQDLETTGGVKIFQVKLKKMLDISNKFSGIVVILNDITDNTEIQRELEAAKTAAERANKAKSEFLAHMSHELRTPLNGILGYAQILKNDHKLTGSQMVGVEIIEKSGNHLLNLINDVLDLSKIEANKIELHKTSFKLSDLLKNIIEMTRIRAWEKKIGFRYQRESVLPDYVVGDEKRIGQILINLLSNAIKFTDEGSVSLSASYKDNLAYFVIRDTGIGIEKKKLAEIFTPFTQLTQREGTGLGLSISKKLIQLMNGSLKVESNPGEGAQFTVCFELPESADYKKGAVPTRGAICNYEGERKRVLIIDDKEINRLVLLDFLSPLGFIISQAIDGAVGYKMAREQKPDLIITDLVMPEMDGFELIRKIKEETCFEGVKIFAVSGSAFEPESDKGHRFGSDEFISKPINFEKLLEKIALHLSITWIYTPVQTFEKPVKTEEIKKQFAPILPPDEVIKTLYNFALEGDLDSIKEELKKNEEIFPAAKSFFTKLTLLARDYKIGEICDYLESLAET